ncbi:Uncharacterised protein [Mycobacteroides abscessus subsp. abscessus]|nr:Uncharacterised protein [Mycobacteroides abscessus subsp. abscessus]SKU37426.1 Uncharacterised protein [Mycobacteroides abscessus subsp. abscessus]
MTPSSAVPVRQVARSARPACAQTRRATEALAPDFSMEKNLAPGAARAIRRPL